MITSTTQMLADFMLSHEAEFAESITDFDYLEQFAAVLAVNYNLRNGKPHPITEGCQSRLYDRQRDTRQTQNVG